MTNQTKPQSINGIHAGVPCVVLPLAVLNDNALSTTDKLLYSIIRSSVDEWGWYKIDFNYLGEITHKEYDDVLISLYNLEKRPYIKLHSSTSPNIYAIIPEINKHLTTKLTQVPHQILDDNQLSPGDIVTYITILRHSSDLDHCSMSNDDFMKGIRISSATLQKHLKKLKECGYITTEVTRGNNRLIKINFDAIKTQGDNNAR